MSRGDSVTETHQGILKLRVSSLIGLLFVAAAASAGCSEKMGSAFAPSAVEGGAGGGQLQFHNADTQPALRLRVLHQLGKKLVGTRCRNLRKQLGRLGWRSGSPAGTRCRNLRKQPGRLGWPSERLAGTRCQSRRRRPNGLRGNSGRLAGTHCQSPRRRPSGPQERPARELLSKGSVR